MRTFLTLLGTTLLFSSSAQTHLLGIEAGPTFAQTVREDVDYYNTLNAGSVGAFYEYKKKNFTSTFGLGYLNKGFKQELIYTDEIGTVLGEGAVERVRHNYLSVSEIVGIEFGENKYFGFTGIGLRASVYSNTIVSSQSFSLNDGTTVEGYKWELDYLNLIDLSALARVGAGIRTEKGNIFYISGSYDFGLTNTLESETPARHRNISLLLGFKRSVLWSDKKEGQSE
ncbi:MAG: hypothetical protein AB8B56_02560 [Crocinitomicaceae bacterium]